MKMDVRIKGVDQVRTELRHTADRVADAARGAMRRAALRIRDQARINAPRDLWNLEEAIEIVRTTGTNGRLQLDIDVLPTMNGANIAQYALIIHETYEDIIVQDGDPDRRQGTREKQAQYPGHYIGGKFLERAAEKEQKTLTRYLISNVTKAIEGSS